MRRPSVQSNMRVENRLYEISVHVGDRIKRHSWWHVNIAAFLWTVCVDLNSSKKIVRVAKGARQASNI